MNNLYEPKNIFTEERDAKFYQLLGWEFLPDPDDPVSIGEAEL